MTMVSSGQIQLGGSNTSGSLNRSVALELGVGGTAQADINGSTYRSLAGRPSGQISLSDFYSKRYSTNVSVTIGSQSVYHSYNEILGNQYYEYRGFSSGVHGAVSPSSVFGYTISELRTMDLLPTSTYELYIRLSTAGLSQSLFHSVYNSIFGTLLTSSATFTNSGSSLWKWTLSLGTTFMGAASPQTVTFYKTS